jgi:excisionase family DNA binding protein
MELSEILSRLEKLEDAFVIGLQEVRCIRSEIQKRDNQTASLEPLLEPEKVAEILGVDLGYIYSQARAKKIPSIKLGKYRKFSPSQLKKWLDRNNGS